MNMYTNKHANRQTLYIMYAVTISNLCGFYQYRRAF